MILGAEIGLIIMGIMVMINGRLPLSKTRVVYGKPARLLAILALLPLPVSFILGFALGVFYAAQGSDINGSDFQWIVTGIEAGAVVLCAVLIHVIGGRYATKPEAPPMVVNRRRF